MEFVAGETLENLVKRSGRLEVTRLRGQRLLGCGKSPDPA